eukprot:Skav232461  [mRNA]  locus=scaffold75:90035:91390:- [translate_table: standard]
MLWALASLFAHLLCLAPWTVMMRRVDPYMDEVFHIPQAQRYCDGNFTDWDPKITTFPGLYLSSSLARGLSGVFCSKDVLRLENLFYGVGTHIVMYRLLRRRLDESKAAAHSFMLSVYPIHFFFQTLYYTDVGALFWTLLTHELVMPMPNKALPSRRIMLAGMAGCVAVLFRQTNAVWLMFTFGTAVLHDLQQSPKWGPALTQNAISPTVLMTFCKALLMESPRLLLRFGFLLVPVLTFVGFVAYNGSIVVGDHSNHQVAAHWAQLAYLSAVTAATSGVGFGSALSLGSFKDFASDCFGSFRSVLLLLASLGLTAYLLHFYSLEHPFLLADNRHYTFYIWKRFLSRPWFKEALAPGYVYAAWYLCRRNSVHGGLWVLIWWVAAVLTLVPAPLLEPRYWTTAVLIAHVHSPEYTWLSLFATSSVFLLINVLTLCIFVHRPFWWPGGEVARFMW